MDDAAALIELEGARLGYGRQAVLEAVDLVVRRGDFLAIVGPNGSGKTTLLRTLLGVLPPLGGRCAVAGRLGYAPQKGTLDPIYPFTAAEVVAMGLLGEAAQQGVRDPRVARALAASGLGARADAPFRDLSGGQKQRVLVARALVAEPEVLVLDEPTNDLDLRGEHEVMELVRSLHEAGRTVVVVSHDLGIVARYAQRVAFIRHGRLSEGSAEALLTGEHLSALYGIDVVVGDFAGRRAVAPGGALPPAGEPGP